MSSQAFYLHIVWIVYKFATRFSEVLSFHSSSYVVAKEEDIATQLKDVRHYFSALDPVAQEAKMSLNCTCVCHIMLSHMYVFRWKCLHLCLCSGGMVRSNQPLPFSSCSSEEMAKALGDLLNRSKAHFSLRETGKYIVQSKKK